MLKTKTNTPLDLLKAAIAEGIAQQDENITAHKWEFHSKYEDVYLLFEGGLPADPPFDVSCVCEKYTFRIFSNFYGRWTLCGYPNNFPNGCLIVKEGSHFRSAEDMDPIDVYNFMLSVINYIYTPHPHQQQTKKD